MEYLRVAAGGQPRVREPVQSIAANFVAHCQHPGHCSEGSVALPFFNYQHVALPYEFSSVGEVNWNPRCWHSMSTYLDWLDSTISVDEKCRR